MKKEDLIGYTIIVNRLNKLLVLTHGKIHAGFVGQKQPPALFKFTGGWTTLQHEVRTNLTAKR